MHLAGKIYADKKTAVLRFPNLYYIYRLYKKKRKKRTIPAERSG